MITLKEEINARNLLYSCYDVFGDPTDQSQVQDLSICTSMIITAVQRGMDVCTNHATFHHHMYSLGLLRIMLILPYPGTLPEPNDCFRAGSGL